MALTAEQLRLREGKLSASVIGCLMTGESDKLLNLWRFMVGDPEHEDRDWHRFWPARLGEASEAVNLEWYEYSTNRKLARHGEVVVHPKYDWACCTLDAFDDQLVGPVDAKHVGGFEKREAIVARYTPQMTWQMDCLGMKRAALSIIEGAREPVIEHVAWDAEYSAELWRRAEAFMECVWTLTPPAALAPVAAPVAATIEYDMRENNWWGDKAGDWVQHRAASRIFLGAEKEIKAMVPADAKRAFGHGIEVTRNKAGALSIKELKA